MTPRTRKLDLAVPSLFISIAGLALLPLLLINPPPTIIVPWQTQLIGAGFGLICVLGIIAGVSPTHCSRPFRTRREKTKVPDSEQHAQAELELHKRGHHPTCQHYSGHIMVWGSRTFCAGCTGLVTGALIALFGTILFFFFSWQFLDPIPIFWVGFLLVAFGLLQHMLYQFLGVNHGVVRFAMNILFVLGPLMLLASLVQITNNLVLALYLLLLTLYWIFTRIVMSRRSHTIICASCANTDCLLREA
ncbi:MAG: hypothetical protein ACFE89_06000 [Candidatus Hodarchaeota archaeon]